MTETKTDNSTYSLKDFYNELKALYRANLYLPQESSTIIYAGEPRRGDSTKEIKNFLISLVKLWSKITPEIKEQMEAISLAFKNTIPRAEKEANDCLDDMANKNYIFLRRDMKSLFFDIEFMVASLQKIAGFEKIVVVREYSQMDFVHYTERTVKECEKPSWGHFWKKKNQQTGEWEMWKEDFDSSD